MGKYKRHSAEYIAESVRLITEESWTYAQVAEAAEVHVNTVSNWVKQAWATGREQSLEDAKDKRIRELAAENKRLEKELAFSKKSSSLARDHRGLIPKRTIFEAIERWALEGRFEVGFMCAYLGVSESGYYKSKKRGRSTRDIEDEGLEKEVIKLHADGKGDAGTRTVRAGLAAEGKRHGRARIGRLMRRNGICGRYIRSYRTTTTSDGKPYGIPGLIGRDFSPGAPDVHWCGDITYIKTAAGWAYKATVIDIGTRRVVGRAVDTCFCQWEIVQIIGERLHSLLVWKGADYC